MPTNIASLPSQTAAAERLLGLDSEVYEYSYAAEQSPLTYDPTVHFTQLPQLFRSMRGIATVLDYAKVIRQSDIIHWYAGSGILPRDLDTRLIRWLRKPGIVEWTGSEIRDPETEAQDNPVFAQRLKDFPELQTMWSAERSRVLQQRFHALGFTPIAATGMVQYVLPEYRGSLRIVDRALPLDDYTPVYPEATGRPVRIAHAPSKRSSKGTDLVQRAIEHLRSRVDVEFVLIEGVLRQEALTLLASADIVFDQFVVGDFGMLALEAMALGKPVVCYMKPSLAKAYGEELPIVSATPDELPRVMSELVSDPARLARLGREGRRYVERHADVHERARTLEAIYTDVLSAHAQRFSSRSR